MRFSLTATVTKFHWINCNQQQQTVGMKLIFPAQYQMSKETTLARNRLHSWECCRSSELQQCANSRWIFCTSQDSDIFLNINVASLKIQLDFYHHNTQGGQLTVPGHISRLSGPRICQVAPSCLQTPHSTALPTQTKTRHFSLLHLFQEIKDPKHPLHYLLPPVKLSNSQMVYGPHTNTRYH